MAKRTRPALPSADPADAGLPLAQSPDEKDDLPSTMQVNDHMIVSLPLDAVDTKYLIRDRLGLDPEAMDSLVASLLSRGQQTPIEVVDLGSDAEPRFGLISGWRRLQALKRISEAGVKDVEVLAFLRQPEQASDAYLAMVEENEIRVGLSYYERARVTLKAVEQGAYPDKKAALQSLFYAASRTKRSKIRSFLTVVEALDGTISFPEGLGERLGLHLSKALQKDPMLGSHLRNALNNALATDSAGEQAVIVKQLIYRTDATGVPLPMSADTRQLGRGLSYTRYKNGNVLLSGADLHHGLWHDLIDWLIARQLKGS